MDKVRPLKLENIPDGGTETDMWPTEIDPAEDYAVMKGLVFENNDNIIIDVDGSGNLQFEDTVTGVKTLAELNTNYWDRTGTNLSPATSGDSLSIVGANADFTNTGTPAGLWAYRTDGKALALAAGSGNATLRFDDSAGFQIQAQSRANLEAQNGTNLNTIYGITTNQIINNISYGDVDFSIRNSGSTDAYKYDAGLDTHTFDGQLNIGDSIYTTAVETITAASDTLDNTNHAVLCDCTSNAITINLPASSGNTGLRYEIIKTDTTSNKVTIDANASELIDGELTQVLGKGDAASLLCNGTGWLII